DLANGQIATALHYYPPSWVISRYLFHHTPVTVLFIMVSTVYAFHAAAVGTTTGPGITPACAPATHGQQGANCPPAYDQPAYDQPPHEWPSHNPPSYRQPQASQYEPVPERAPQRDPS